MSRTTSEKQRLVAAFVTVIGVAAIWAFSAWRQEGQTEALGRQWVGEQWDLARYCLVGTPLHRGEPEADIAWRLEARLYQTLLEASESEGDPEARWPTSCVARLASLRADPSVLEGDPGDAIATLEVLAPRVIHEGTAGPARFAVGDAFDRVRELAEPIARLDEVMPPGGAHDPSRYPEPAFDVATVRRSMACSASPAVRPFLGEGALLDEIEIGAVSRRLVAEEGAYRQLEAGPDGTDERALARDGFTAPRFVGEEVGWLASDGRTLAVGDRTIALTGLPEGATRFASCSAGDATHLALLAGEQVYAARIDGDTAAAIAVRPRPPREGARFFCGEDAAAFAWFDDGRWRGALCRDGECRALPPLEAGGDLSIALGPEVLAVGRGRATDLPVARALDDDAWGEPFLAVRGRVVGTNEGYAAQTCDGRLVSRDGRRWRAAR